MSFLEEVLIRTREVESLLGRRFNATGKGLYEKAASVSHLLGSSLTNRIRFIAAVRNKLVHQHQYKYDGDEREFLLTCDKVIANLEGLPLQPHTPSQHNVFVSQSKNNAGTFKSVLIAVKFLVVFGVCTTILLLAASTFWSKRFPRTIPKREQVEAIKVSPKILESYTGDYKYGNNSIRVRMNGDYGLRIYHPVFSVSWHSTSESTFAPDIIDGFDGQVKFVKNKQGKVTHLLLMPKNGEQSQAKKIS